RPAVRRIPGRPDELPLAAARLAVQVAARREGRVPPPRLRAPCHRPWPGALREPPGRPGRDRALGQPATRGDRAGRRVPPAGVAVDAHLVAAGATPRRAAVAGALAAAAGRRRSAVGVPV